MKNKLMLGMLCVALLMCSLPVSAATNACSHDYVSYSLLKSSKYVDNDYHISTYEQGESCTICSAVKPNSAHNVEKSEIHLVSGIYTDLGHGGAHEHRFNVYCPTCQHHYTLTIACDGNSTGMHVHP